jgi:hypothetical protein
LLVVYNITVTTTQSAAESFRRTKRTFIPGTMEMLGGPIDFVSHHMLVFRVFIVGSRRCVLTRFRSVGPTLFVPAWGDRSALRRPRSGVPLKPVGGPDAIRPGVGGPFGTKEAAQRCTFRTGRWARR